MLVAVIFLALLTSHLWLLGGTTGTSWPWHYDYRGQACRSWTGHLHFGYPGEQCCWTGEQALFIVWKCCHLHWMNLLCCQTARAWKTLLHADTLCVLCNLPGFDTFLRMYITLNFEILNCLSTDEWYYAQELVFVKRSWQHISFFYGWISKIVIFQLLYLLLMFSPLLNFENRFNSLVFVFLRGWHVFCTFNHAQIYGKKTKIKIYIKKKKKN